LGHFNSLKATEYLTIKHAINLAPVHGYNFGHWMLEDLPKLRAAKIYERQTGTHPKIIVHKNPPDWVTDSLRVFGYGESDLIEFNGTPLEVESLIQPIHKAIRLIEGEVAPENYNWVEKEMKQNTDWSRYKHKFSDRVYISRAQMDKRRVVNEQEVLEALSPLGFERYQPETMSFSEQIALFEGASIVVGTQGSALSNLIYSSDAHVIELLPHDHVLLTWFEVMQSLGHEYTYVQGLPPSGEDNTQQRPKQDLSDFYWGRDNNLRIDINTLKQAIGDLGGVKSE
jgi:capsular polysaccharide biosynthesis protein